MRNLDDCVCGVIELELDRNAGRRRSLKQHDVGHRRDHESEPHTRRRTVPLAVRRGEFRLRCCSPASVSNRPLEPVCESGYEGVHRPEHYRQATVRGSSMTSRVWGVFRCSYTFDLRSGTVACVTPHGLSPGTLKKMAGVVEYRRVIDDRTGDPAFARALAAARVGQAPGFEWLWNRFGRQVAGFARAQGADDADGITNEAFLGAFRRVDTFFGNEDAFVAMLFAITRNKLIDEHRARSRRVPTRQLVRDDDGHGGDVESDALSRIGADATSLLATLTDEQREVMHLRLIADLSLEQTAMVTGRSVNAVKALQHRATNALRRTISEEAVTQ